MNKAKEKMADKAKENLGPVAPGEQLTDDLLGKVVTGAQAADRVLADRDKAQTTREAKDKELSALMEKNAPTAPCPSPRAWSAPCRDRRAHGLQPGRR